MYSYIMDPVDVVRKGSIHFQRYTLAPYWGRQRAIYNICRPHACDHILPNTIPSQLYSQHGGDDGGGVE